jgi:hypothetical protein
MLRVKYQFQCPSCDTRVLYTHELLKKGGRPTCGAILTPEQDQGVMDGLEKMKNALRRE